MKHTVVLTVPMEVSARTPGEAVDQAIEIMRNSLVRSFYSGADTKNIAPLSKSVTTLVSNSVAMTPEQLLEVTEGMVRISHKKGHRDSPKPNEEDIWTMFEALNFTLWLCPDTGQRACALLRKKYA